MDISLVELKPSPRDKNCKGLCKEWKNMINFIPRVPRYRLGDRCKTCLIWFPKFIVVKCPCCRQRVRTRPDQKLKTYPPETEIQQIIIDKKATGWTILKNDKIIKKMLQFEYVNHSYKIRK